MPLSPSGRTLLAEDQALVSRVRANAVGAFAELMHRYSARVYSIGLNLLRNEQDAREVVQETFLNVHRHIRAYRGDAPLGAWVARIATNHALMRLRRRKRKADSGLAFRAPDLSDAPSSGRYIVDRAPLQDKIAINRELGERIRLAVDQLPASQREVMVLADYRCLSMEQVARTLDLSVPNAKSRLHRARLQVREALRDYLAGRE